MYEVYAQQVDQLRLKLMQRHMQQRLLGQTTVDAIYAPSAISVARTIINSAKQKLEWLHKQLVDSNQKLLCKISQIRFQQLVEKLSLLSPVEDYDA